SSFQLTYFFFFQAEDGIRDFHVTGVQTCALPISTSNIISAAELTCTHILSLARHVPAAHASLADGQWKRSSYTGTELFEKTLGRSEERRVGKECRSRQSPRQWSRTE